MPIKLWGSESVSSQVAWKRSAYLHLPVGHILRAVLHPAKEPVERGWQHVCICEVWVRGGSCRGSARMDLEYLGATQLSALRHASAFVWIRGADDLPWSS